jgi:2-keto-4-pentenoate hydratase/2-oxohepta-3-ene-1,7-dioic acid hydratase in catechol pathway
MTRLVTTGEGVGRLDGESVELLDVPYRDLGTAFAAGLDVAALAGADVRARRPFAALRILAPVLRPPKVWAVGWAYRAHRAEGQAAPEPEEPFFFLKAPSSVVGPGEPIRLPAVAPDRVDYEGELAIVIGRGGQAIAREQAHEHIAGFTAANDVSARDVQKGERAGRLANVSLGKSFDTFTPMGPCLTTLDEFADPDDLLLETTVDGELRQQARTSDLLYDVAEQVAYISAYTTLEPGDVILTGTPAGVGFASGAFLRDGSVVRIELEGVGVLENTVAHSVAVAEHRTGRRV